MIHYHFSINSYLWSTIAQCTYWHYLFSCSLWRRHPHWILESFFVFARPFFTDVDFRYIWSSSPFSDRNMYLLIAKGYRINKKRGRVRVLHKKRVGWIEKGAGIDSCKMKYYYYTWSEGCCYYRKCGRNILKTFKKLNLASLHLKWILWLMF